MLVSVEGGKPENPEKNPRSKARTSNKLNPYMAPGRNRTQATLVGGDRSRYCAIPDPKIKIDVFATIRASYNNGIIFDF